jgi:ferric-dicitrate binding protein FerR (iron transport regulator)
VDLLYGFKAFAVGPSGLYMWGALAAAVVYALVQVALRPGSPVATDDNAPCLAGRVSVATGGPSWQSVSLVPPGVLATAADDDSAVVGLPGGTTVRFDGSTSFTWRPAASHVLVTLQEGHAWFDIHGPLTVALPSASWEAEAGTVAEVNLNPTARHVEVIRCRAGHVDVSCSWVQANLPPVKVALTAGEGAMLDAAGQWLKASNFGPDSPWQAWNKTWGLGAPGFRRAP